MTNKMAHHDELFFSRDKLKKDLKRRTVQSALIKISVSGIVTLLTMTSIIVLARLLAPEEFGLLVMVTTITEFTRSFRELGLGTATVQREEISHNEVSTLFWINFGLGITIMLLLISISPVLVWFYGDSRLLYICMVLSSLFFFGGLTVQHRALLERQMRFGSLGAINIVSTIISISVCILLALNGVGVWALVCRDIIFVALYVAGVWLLCGWIPGLPKRNTGVRSSLKFGADVSSFEIIRYLTGNLDRVLIGRLFGATSLGLYSKAFQFAMMPIEHIRMIFWDVGLSPLSALQDDAERFRRFYSKLLSVMTFIYMPMVLLLAIKSEDAIRLLLGEAWLEAAPIFRIIAIAGFFRPVMATFQLVMISCGKSRRCFKWGAINGLCMIIAFAIGISWGTIGVAYGFAFASYATLIFSFLYCFKDTPVNAVFVIKNIAFPMISSCGAGIILVVLLSHLPSTNALASIVISILVIEAAYLGIFLCIPRGRKQLAEFWSYRTEIFTKTEADG